MQVLTFFFFFFLSGLYYIEYTLKNPGESGRHLFSVLGVANNGVYNRLYTLTGQVSLAKTVSWMLSLCEELNLGSYYIPLLYAAVS